MSDIDIDLKKVRTIHIMGICGTAMGAFAGMLRNLGYEVTGSDTNAYPPMSTQLLAQGITIKEGYRAENLEPPPDLVVVGNVISRSNPEAQALLASGLPYISMPQALGHFFLEKCTSLVVAGTHGKTTTSSLLAWVLTHNGRDPSFLIGGQLQNFGRNAYLGHGPHFVVEGDEYDTAFFDKGPKFLHYRPKHAIITSVEFDHADIYRDLAHVQESFRKFIQLVPEDGTLICCTDYPALVELLGEARCPVLRYGLKSDAPWSGRIVSVSETGMDVAIDLLGQETLTLHTSLVGEHNLLNLIAVVALCRRLGLSDAEIQAGVATFQGIKRRQEVIAEIGGITLLDDFAHHPTAVAVTLASVRRRFGPRRIWAVFEPRSNTSRRNVFQAQYPLAFADADEVLIAGVQNVAMIAESERMDSHRLAEDIAAAGKSARFCPDVEAIIDLLEGEATPGDVILLMSNGAFGGIYQKLPARLRAKFTT